MALLSGQRPPPPKLAVVPPDGSVPAVPETIVLKFLKSGEAYKRAKAVADRMGLSVRDYLLTCIAEGHFILSVRATDPEELDRPAFERRRSIQTDIDVDEELRKRREEMIKGLYTS